MLFPDIATDPLVFVDNEVGGSMSGSMSGCVGGSMSGCVGSGIFLWLILWLVVRFAWCVATTIRDCDNCDE
jgi:hypothetical protein